MKKIFELLFISISVCLSFSCFCRGPQLSEELIKDSDIIFVGKLVSVDTIQADSIGDDLKLTFKCNKIYKGEKQKTIEIRSALSSCGFLMTYSKKQSYIGKTYLIYSNKEAEQYRYQLCTNRIVVKTPMKHKYYEEQYKKDLIIYDSIFKSEETRLESLIKQ